MKLPFQLTKESRHALQAGEHINKPTLAQEYAILDKAATASESYLKGRLKTIEEQLAEIEKDTEEKDNENQVLQHQIKELEAQLQKERGANKDAIALEMAENQPQRMRRIMRRNQVIQKIKEQQDLMDSLQDQLENYMHRSFPSLG